MNDRIIDNFRKNYMNDWICQGFHFHEVKVVVDINIEEECTFSRFSQNTVWVMSEALLQSLTFTDNS